MKFGIFYLKEKEDQCVLDGENPEYEPYDLYIRFFKEEEANEALKTLTKFYNKNRLYVGTVEEQPYE